MYAILGIFVIIALNLWAHRVPFTVIRTWATHIFLGLVLLFGALCTDLLLALL
jgi:hypothetical protein